MPIQRPSLLRVGLGFGETPITRLVLEGLEIGRFLQSHLLSLGLVLIRRLGFQSSGLSRQGMDICAEESAGGPWVSELAILGGQPQPIRPGYVGRRIGAWLGPGEEWGCAG
jgi:hypothetical protein